MKNLALLLIMVGLTCSADAESFRIMQVSSHTLDLAKLAPRLLDADKLGAVASDPSYSVIEYIVVRLGADGRGEVDQTYPVEYAQSYSDSGEAREPAIRRVGIQAKIQKKPNGDIAVSYSSTRLERWHFYGPDMKFEQPIFSTDGMQWEAPLTNDGIFLIGGLFKPAKTTPPTSPPEQRLFLIQRIPSPTSSK